MLSHIGSLLIHGAELVLLPNFELLVAIWLQSSHTENALTYLEKCYDGFSGGWSLRQLPAESKGLDLSHNTTLLKGAWS